MIHSPLRCFCIPCPPRKRRQAPPPGTFPPHQEGRSMEALFTHDLEAVIFDFEGTLVDFQWKLSEAVEEVLEKLRQMGFTATHLSNRKYSTLQIQAMQAAPQIGIRPQDVRDAIGAVYDVYDEDALTRWNLRPGAPDFLRALRTMGIRTALVSNVGGRALGKAITRLGLESLLDMALSRNDVPNLKPSPDGINLALHKMGANRRHSIFVGDSLDDINAARNAGLKVMIITNGENLREDIIQAKPDAIFDNYQELIGALPS